MIKKNMIKCECGVHETEIHGFKLWTCVTKPLPTINLTTGETEQPKEKDFLTLSIDTGEELDYIRINYCPWCGLELEGDYD